MLDFLKGKLTGNFELKSLTEGSIRHPATNPVFLWTLPRTKIDYKKEVGTGIGSSSVMAPIQWIQRAFPEAPLTVYKLKNDIREKVPLHPLIQLINTPNPYYSGIALWWASIFSWITTGNVYWLIERNMAGKPVKLWWVAPWLIKPLFPKDGSEFLTGYEYSAGNQKQKLNIEDVFHIKHGIDPNNPRLGISPLYSCMREIWNDDEASNFVAALLRNSGVPGMIISPDSDNPAEASDVDVTKAYFKEMFSGDKRGEPLVMGGKTKVDQFGFSPDKMDLSSVRDVTEERVCAALGIPAAVVGFGTGLQQTKVGATMKELRELAWINGIRPIQTIFAYEIERTLLPLFESNPTQYEVDFDISNVAALDDDLDKKFLRGQMGVAGGFMEVAEAREMVGLDVRDEDHIYLRPASSFETPAPMKGARIEDGKIIRMKALKQPTPAEGRAIADAPRRRPSRDQVRLIRRLDELQRKQSEAFAKNLTRVFDNLGKAVAEVAMQVLKSAAFEQKDFTELDLLAADTDAGKIAQLVDLDPIKRALEDEYVAAFDQIAHSTFSEANSALGLGVNLPDPVARRIVATGGRRLGLIDLRGQVKNNLFRTITEARSQGLGPDAIARLIREDIPKGPWTSVEIRSRIISHTETKFAQNQSMIEYSKTSGATHMMIFDNRTGFDDEECSALDGVIVSIAEAESLMDDEHPNGTRSATPIYESIDEQTG